MRTRIGSTNARISGCAKIFPTREFEAALRAASKSGIATARRVVSGKNSSGFGAAASSANTSTLSDATHTRQQLTDRDLNADMGNSFSKLRERLYRKWNNANPI